MDSIKETFEYGGYYRVDLTDDISVLALNTLYFDGERSEEIETDPKGKEQLKWFREQLDSEADSKRKFIPISHVYPGARYEAQEMWDREAAAIYFDILKNHRD